MIELDQFTVERLTELSTRENLPEVAALARIALAAKNAIPSYWTTYYPNPDPGEFDDREHSHSGAKSCAVRIAGEIGGFVVPVYHGAPPANSPETPDGWIACSDRTPVDCQTVLCSNLLTDLSGIPFIADYVGAFQLYDGTKYESGFYVNRELQTVTHWMPLPAAPKPEK